MIDYLGTGDRLNREARLVSVVALAKRLLTTAVMPREARKAAHFAETNHPLRLHLGCGAVLKPGWVNVDYAQPVRLMRLAAPVATRLGWIEPDFEPAPPADLSWDIRRRLPFRPDSVDAIFAEHVLEHFTYAAGLELVRNCYAILRSGGVLRLGVPDLECYVRGYLGADPALDEVHPNRPTRAVALSEIFYRYGHRAGYDFETLAVLCRDAGFISTGRSSFGEGRLGPIADSESRRSGTLYVEAIKR